MQTQLVGILEFMVRV